MLRLFVRLALLTRQGAAWGRHGVVVGDLRVLFIRKRKPFDPSRRCFPFPIPPGQKPSAPGPCSGGGRGVGHVRRAAPSPIGGEGGARVSGSAGAISGAAVGEGAGSPPAESTEHHQRTEAARERYFHTSGPVSCFPWLAFASGRALSHNKRKPWCAFLVLSFQFFSGSTRNSLNHIFILLSHLSLSVYGPRKPCKKQQPQNKVKAAVREIHGHLQPQKEIRKMNLEFINLKAMALQMELPQRDPQKFLTRKRIKGIHS